MWKNTDPRWDIYKWARIIILKPVGNGHDVSIGDVETKHGWNIWTSFENYKNINADMEWDESWLWTRLPDIKDIKGEK